jgi:hypothetical protein
VKPGSVQIALIGVLLTAVLQGGCSARMDDQSDRMVTTSHEEPSPSDDQRLMTDVEQFASSDEGKWVAAWQNLQTRSRPKLIEDLTRISNASASDDRKRVLIAFTFCNLGHDYAANREIVLSALSKHSPFTDLLGDWAASLVRRLAVKGDHDLLVPLFDASEWSDGAMSQELAGAYSQTLALDPATFLRMLSSRPEQTRSRVMLLLTDNYLTEDENRKVMSYLKHVSGNASLGPLAKQVMRALRN